MTIFKKVLMPSTSITDEEITEKLLEGGRQGIKDILSEYQIEKLLKEYAKELLEESLKDYIRNEIDEYTGKESWLDWVIRRIKSKQL
jgi:hypothetical protein